MAAAIMVLGSAIGIISWHLMNQCRNSNEKEFDLLAGYNGQRGYGWLAIKLVVTVFVVFLSFNFFSSSIWKLATIKH